MIGRSCSEVVMKIDNCDIGLFVTTNSNQFSISKLMKTNHRKLVANLKQYQFEREYPNCTFSLLCDFNCNNNSTCSQWLLFDDSSEGGEGVVIKLKG